MCRFPFQTERSQITFDPEKRYPDTPTLNISATGVLVSDRSDATQNINIQVVGPLGSPQLAGMLRKVNHLVRVEEA